MKPVPILGTLVLIGAVIQVLVGLQVARGSPALRGIHIIFGIVGLILLIALAAIATMQSLASGISNVFSNAAGSLSTS